MFPKEFPVIKTERSLLRELQEDDAVDLIEVIGFNMSNPDQYKAAIKVKQLKEIFQKEEGITWGMIYNNKLIGTIGFYRGFANETGEIGYVMKKAYKRQGLMFEACLKILSYGLNNLSLCKITAYTEADNTASVSMLTKLGFIKTEIQKERYTIFELNRA